MSFDFLRSATASSSAYRVVCGEMIIDDIWNVHNEVLVAVVRDGYMTIEMGANTYSLSAGDIYFISPNQRYKINNTGNARVEVVLLNLSNPASLTQEFIPQSLIRGLVTGNCTHFAKVPRGDYRYNNLIDDINTVITAENEKHEFFQILVHGKMYDIFYILFSSGLVKICDVEAQGKKYRALRRITEYINNNFCDSITLDTIAQTTGLSRYYVSHLFKELMNTTFQTSTEHSKCTMIQHLQSTEELRNSHYK